jgi:hypothetical protein
MLTLTMQPLVGMGPIKFGMTRSEVRDTLADFGQPKAVLRPRILTVSSRMLFKFPSMSMAGPSSSKPRRRPTFEFYSMAFVCTRCPPKRLFALFRSLLTAPRTSRSKGTRTFSRLCKSLCGVRSAPIPTLRIAKAAILQLSALGRKGTSARSLGSGPSRLPFAKSDRYSAKQVSAVRSI